jgi:hypothetical protein
MLIVRFDVAADDIGPMASAAPARAARVKKSRRPLVLDAICCSLVFMTSLSALARCIPASGDCLGFVSRPNVDTLTEKKNDQTLNTL